LVNVSSSTDTSVTLDLSNLGGAVAINLTAVNVDRSNINLAIQFSKELFIQLNRQQDARRDHYDGLRAVCLLKTAQGVKDHHKGLAAACGAGQTPTVSTLQGIEHTLLVWAKGQGQMVSCVVGTIIGHEKGGARPPCDTY